MSDVKGAARVYVQVRETGEIMMLESWSVINVDLNMRAGSTATIEISNERDKWYTFGRKNTKSTAVAQYLRSVYNQPRALEINQKIRAIRKSADSAKTPEDRQKFLDQLWQLETVMLFDVMYRVWIDFRGRDNLVDLGHAAYSSKLPPKWYAGFTGVITSVHETYNARNKTNGITLQCRDMRRMFEVVKVSTKQGLRPIFQTEADKQGLFSVFANSLSSYLDGCS